MTPPPGGPRDWSPSDFDASAYPSVGPSNRPIRGANHIVGIGWGRFLAWVSFGLGVATLLVVFTAPLDGELTRVAVIAFFASFAVWFGLMAEPRYRFALGRGSVVGKVGIGFGTAAGAVAVYAFIAIVLVTYGTSLPTPAQWLGSASTGTAAGLEPTGTTGDEAPASSPPAVAMPADRSMAGVPQAINPPADATEERMQLAMVVGTAATMLEHIQPTGGPWPASLAVSTDGTQLIGPAGVALVNLPPGAEVAYSASADGMTFSLTLVGTAFGSVATIDSTSDYVTVN